MNNVDDIKNHAGHYTDALRISVQKALREIVELILKGLV